MDKNTNKDFNTELHTDIVAALRDLEFDVTNRNKYMQERYDAIYGDGLWRDQPIDGWFAEYNLVERVVDIYTSQLFGRGFALASDYSKEDLTPYEKDPATLEQMQLKNKKLKADADARVAAAKAIIVDNGGMAKFEDGSRIGSALGVSVFKMYPDTKNKRVVISLIESPQNYRAGWSADDFRERDFDAYVSQISEDKAYREYSNDLKDGDEFIASKVNDPLMDQMGSLVNTATALRTGVVTQTERKMVTVIDFVGYLKGWGLKDGKLQKVKRGKETPFACLDVGGKIFEIETDEKKLPKFYVINNRQVPRQAWGASDISNSLIDINREIIRLMADEMEWADKNLWKVWLGKGMTEEVLSKLKGKKRKTKVLAIAPEQDLSEMSTSPQPLTEMARLIEQKLDLFVRIAGVGRVLFDDPTVNANSNQALMTTLKGVVDAIESKQKRWEVELAKMFTDGLYMAADMVPALKEVLDDDPNWSMKIEWPSILRREDAAYQTMWLNALNAKTLSLETYLQKLLGDSASEELDRLRDEYKDPVTAAILGGITAALAGQTVTPAPTTPPTPDVKYNVSVKADASLDPTANADLIRVVDPALPDQGTPSMAKQGAMPTPQSGQAPTLTTDQNTGQGASMPGSGATSTSPEGAIAQANQQRGQ